MCMSEQAMPEFRGGAVTEEQRRAILSDLPYGVTSVDVRMICSVDNTADVFYTMPDGKERYNLVRTIMRHY